MVCPCKDCPDRDEGCHGKCERYKAYADWRKTLKPEYSVADEYLINEKKKLQKRRRVR